jgi:hypothetical protein
LASLLQQGCADLVFTFNIDDLLDQAFAKAGLREGADYLAIDVPKLREQAAVVDVVRRDGPRIRLVRLHGHYKSGFNCMTSAEIAAFDLEIHKLVEQYSGRAAIVCGYSFFHLNVLNAFSRTGGAFFYVNKTFPEAPMVLSLMACRSQAHHFIDEPLGLFENFIQRLVQELRI